MRFLLRVSESVLLLTRRLQCLDGTVAESLGTGDEGATLCVRPDGLGDMQHANSGNRLLSLYESR